MGVRSSGLKGRSERQESKDLLKFHACLKEVSLKEASLKEANLKAIDPSEPKGGLGADGLRGLPNEKVEG